VPAVTDRSAVARAAGPAEHRLPELCVRVCGAGLLAATGWIHLHLWLHGYRGIAWIGPLFLADVVLGAGLALAVLLAPARWLPWACAAGALLEAGTLGGLLLGVSVGFLGFVETWAAPLAVPSAVVEAAGAVVLGGFAAGELGRSSHRRRWGRG
jgi:hypothetical protein